MENSDMFGSSTAPLTWHDFLERMRQPSAADFVKAIKSFIVSFSNNPPDPERDSAAVQDFLSNMETAFRAHSLWAGCSEEELESAGEGLEKYVMTKLFPRVFATLHDDVKVDDQLHEKMALIQQFIRPENLDIKPTYQNETSWLLAQKELQKINMYKAPRDKLVCILNCCKVISNLLMNASIASNESTPGADEFLPVLIYVTIKANPPQLHSNLLYIQRYRRQSRLVAETAYYFTNLLSVESFILNIDANSISMDETEFENNMESARAILFGLSAESDNLFRQTDSLPPRADTTEPKQQSPRTMHRGPASQSQLSFGSLESKLEDSERDPPPKAQSVSDLESKGAATIMEEDQVNKIFRDFPFFFSQSGDLTVGDVDELLRNYKNLVFKYVCLAKGLGISDPSPSLSTSENQSLHQTENVKESEDSGAGESNSEEEKDSVKRDDYSNEVSMLGMQNASSVTQEYDEAAAPQDEVTTDDNSPNR